MAQIPRERRPMDGLDRQPELLGASTAPGEGRRHNGGTMFYRDERLALVIDGPGLHAAARALGFSVDYRLLRDTFARRCKLVRLQFYTVLDDDENSPVRPLVDWLTYNGYSAVVTHQREFIDDSGRRKVKGSIGVELAVGAIEIAREVEHVLLCSGDRGYVRLVHALKRKGVRVTVASTRRGSPPMIADDLRRAADSFLELDDLRELIARPPRAEAAQIAVGAE